MLGIFLKEMFHGWIPELMSVLEGLVSRRAAGGVSYSGIADEAGTTVLGDFTFGIGSPGFLL